MKILLFMKAVAAAALMISAVAARADAFPVKPVLFVAPFAPGGAVDILARAMAQGMTKEFSQSVVVENKAGASGIIGSQFVAQAKPDGYTILLGTTTNFGIHPSFHPKLPYDVVRDFSPVMLIATIPHVLVVNPSFPANTLDEFLKVARERKGGLTFGSAGIGSPHHLAGELLRTRTGIQATHVPYKGSGPAMLGVMSGEIDFMSTELTAALAQIKSGKVKAIALAGTKRSPELAVPTYTEAGLPDFVITAWYAMFAPSATPKATIARLNDAASKALSSGDVREKLSSLGADPTGGTPELLGKHVKEEIARWAVAVKSSGATME